jgi:hypothetical protein
LKNQPPPRGALSAGFATQLTSAPAASLQLRSLNTLRYAAGEGALPFQAFCKVLYVPVAAPEVQCGSIAKM